VTRPQRYRENLVSRYTVVPWVPPITSSSSVSRWCHLFVCDWQGCR